MEKFFLPYVCLLCSVGTCLSRNSRTRGFIVNLDIAVKGVQSVRELEEPQEITVSYVRHDELYPFFFEGIRRLGNYICI